MLAVDTNILVRFLTGDHPQQSTRASRLIANEDVFVATTVLLETEWVLRSIFRYKQPDLVEAIAQLAGLPRLHVQDPPLLARALEFARAGMDFADALHLAAAQESDAFVSFDDKFVRLAKSLGAKVRLA